MLLFAKPNIHGPTTVVKSGSREYRRNRTHLLKVNETPECEEIEEPEIKQEEQPRPREETREE